MEYIYNGILIEVKTSQENQNCSSWIYFRIKKVNGNKIYGKLKGGEERHPIMGIVFCTVLGRILVGLVAGVISEAVLLCV